MVPGLTSFATQVTGRGPIVPRFARRFRYDRSCDRSLWLLALPHLRRRRRQGTPAPELSDHPRRSGVVAGDRPERGGRTTIVRSGAQPSCCPRRGAPGPGSTSTAGGPTRRCPAATSCSPTTPTSGSTGCRRGRATAADAGARGAGGPALRGPGVPDGQHCGASGAPRRRAVWPRRSWRSRVAARPQDPGLRERVSGADFYASRRRPRTASHLAWVQWSHPRMPWNGTELRVAGFDPAGKLERARKVKGGLRVGAGPAWRRRASLYVISDWSGWWNLYQVGLYGGSPQALYPAEEEFAGPLWQLGAVPYARMADGSLAVLHGQGDLRLGSTTRETAVLTDFDVPYRAGSWSCPPTGTTLVGVAGAPGAPRSSSRSTPDSGRQGAAQRRQRACPPRRTCPSPRARGVGGPVRARRCTRSSTRPSNPAARRARASFRAVHRVRARRADRARRPACSTWRRRTSPAGASACIDVNYGGSTGYGRVLPRAAARPVGHGGRRGLGRRGRGLDGGGAGDPARIAIRGGSAGGWTSHARSRACTRSAGGVPTTGWRDPRTAAGHPRLRVALHRVADRPVPGFERRLAERVGPVARALTACPMLLLQGLSDPIVSPAQSQRFADALAEAASPTPISRSRARRTASAAPRRDQPALAAELAFYGRSTPDGVRPLKDVAPVELTTERRPLPPVGRRARRRVLEE